MDRALNPNDGGDIRLPLRSDDRRRGIEHGNAPGFVAIAPFRIDGFDLGKRLCPGASDHDRLMQARLVVLELNDQMRVRCRRGVEGFF